MTENNQQQSLGNGIRENGFKIFYIEDKALKILWKRSGTQYELDFEYQYQPLFLPNRYRTAPGHRVLVFFNGSIRGLDSAEFFHHASADEATIGKIDVIIDGKSTALNYE